MTIQVGKRPKLGYEKSDSYLNRRRLAIFFDYLKQGFYAPRTHDFSLQEFDGKITSLPGLTVELK